MLTILHTYHSFLLCAKKNEAEKLVKLIKTAVNKSNLTARIRSCILSKYNEAQIYKEYILY